MSFNQIGDGMAAPRKKQKKKTKTSLLGLRNIEIEILSALSRTFWTALDRQVLSQGLFRLLGKRFKFDAFLFLRLDKDGHQLFLTSSRSLKEAEQKAISEKLQEVHDIHAGIQITTLKVSSAKKEASKPSRFTEGAVHAVPIAIMDKVRGYLGLAFTNDQVLDKEEVDFLQVVANVVALVEENQRIQTILTDESNLLSSILHSMTCAVLVVDDRMRIVLSNPISDSIFGWNVARVIGQPLEKVTDVESILSLFKATAQHANEYLSSEIEIPNKGRGKPMFARANLAKVRSGVGTSSGVVMVLNDITLEKEMERARTEFVSVASHELRTPMAAIREAVSLMIDGVTGDVNEKQHKFLDMARRNIDRLTGIINDLLDLSKIESGNLTLSFAPVRPHQIVDEVFVIFEAAAREKEISLLKNIADDLPNLNLDRDKMIQVMGNLVSNAFKFTPKGGMITIGVRKSQQKEPSVEFYVQDTGIGIERKNFGKLFRKFQQIDSSLSRAVGGTGLGLAISKEIVELHGGRVFLESQPGRGTTFHVILPMSPGPVSRKRHILAVTSDRELEEMINDALGDNSFDVSCVRRGKEVAEQVLASRPDLIFLDARLPDMDAFDICLRLMEDPYTAFVPIVLLAVPGQESSVWKALSMGVRGYLVRPVDSKAVLSTVEEILV